MTDEWAVRQRLQAAGFAATGARYDDVFPHTEGQIREYAALFFREGASQVRFLRELDRLIEKAEEQGFLTLTEDHEVPDEQRFRIRKVIKAKVNPETMEAFKQQLAAHAAQRI